MPADRYESFKRNTNAEIEYRRLYAIAVAKDPAAAERHPDPDDFARGKADPVRALEAIRADRALAELPAE